MNPFRSVPDDLEIINGIASNSARRRVFEDHLYSRYHYLIREGVFKHRLSDDESSIAYSDTILTVIENIEKGVFESRSSLKTYVHRIFSNKCVDQIRKNTTNREKVNFGESVDDYLYTLQDSSRSAIEDLMEQYEASKIWRSLEKLGEKCQEMLRSWSEGKVDKEIAVDLGYQSADVVKTSRLRCLDKLRSIYKQQFD